MGNGICWRRLKHLETYIYIYISPSMLRIRAEEIFWWNNRLVWTLVEQIIFVIVFLNLFHLDRRLDLLKRIFFVFWTKVCSGFGLFLQLGIISSSDTRLSQCKSSQWLGFSQLTHILLQEKKIILPSVWIISNVSAIMYQSKQNSNQTRKNYAYEKEEIGRIWS